MTYWSSGMQKVNGRQRNIVHIIDDERIYAIVPAFCQK